MINYGLLRHKRLGNTPHTHARPVAYPVVDEEKRNLCSVAFEDLSDGSSFCHNLSFARKLPVKKSYLGVFGSVVLFPVPAGDFSFKLIGTQVDIES